MNKTARMMEKAFLMTLTVTVVLILYETNT